MDVGKHPILRQGLKVSELIEACPAGPEQTAAAVAMESFLDQVENLVDVLLQLSVLYDRALQKMDILSTHLETFQKM